MHRSRHVLCALALLLTLNACSGTTNASAPDNDTELLPSLSLVRDEQPRFTPEQVRYLEAAAWRDAETRAFLSSVQQLVDATPPLLWRIMWCESGRPYGMPAYTPAWSKINLHGESSSSGGAQMVDSTWRSNRPSGAEQWPRAYQAPWFVQLAAANTLYASSGTSPWRASSGCWS